MFLLLVFTFFACIHLWCPCTASVKNKKTKLFFKKTLSLQPQKKNNKYFVAHLQTTRLIAYNGRIKLNIDRLLKYLTW